MKTQSYPEIEIKIYYVNSEEEEIEVDVIFEYYATKGYPATWEEPGCPDEIEWWLTADSIHINNKELNEFIDNNSEDVEDLIWEAVKDKYENDF